MCAKLEPNPQEPSTTMIKTTAMHRRHILLEFLVALGFMLFRALHNAMQRLVWCANGTAAQQKAAVLHRTDRSAQLFRVWKKYSFDPYEMHNDPGNFILHHKEFVHPSYVLKDEVSFYCMTKTHAYFVEAPPGVEVWKNNVHPFHKAAQYEHAENVIAMPVAAFYTLAEGMGPIQEKLIFVEFIPRSGSTLLCKIFEECGECVSFSEAHAVNDMFGAYLKEGNSEDDKRRLRAQLRLMCKPRSTPTTAFMFKIFPAELQSKVLGTYLREVFPQAKFLFLYRNGAPMVKSLQRMMLQVNALRLINSLRIFPSLWKRIRVWFVSIGQDFDQDVKDILHATNHIEYLTCGLFWILCVRGQQLQQAAERPAIKYEHLISSPEETISAIFSYCDLPKHLVKAAMKGLKGDSQHNLGMNWDELADIGWAKRSMAEVAEDAHKEMVALCRHFDVPSIYEDCVLSNTISVSKVDPNNNCMDSNNNADLVPNLNIVVESAPQTVQSQSEGPLPANDLLSTAF